MEDYRVIIAGCRGFFNYVTVKAWGDYYLQNKLKTHNVIIVSRHETSADNRGEKFAREHCLKCELFPADRLRFGSEAEEMRNAEMAERSDALIAFWDGKCQRTKAVIDMARRKLLQVAVVRYDLLKYS